MNAYEKTSFLVVDTFDWDPAVTKAVGKHKQVPRWFTYAERGQIVAVSGTLVMDLFPERRMCG